MKKFHHRIRLASIEPLVIEYAGQRYAWVSGKRFKTECPTCGGAGTVAVDLPAETLPRTASCCSAWADPKLSVKAQRMLSVGDTLAIGGRTATVAAVDPYTRKDGSASQLVTWRMDCAACAKPFTFTGGRFLRSDTSRRCPACRPKRAQTSDAA
jgi:hypothetical protein